jgi:hypothetical protein
VFVLEITASTSYFILIQPAVHVACGPVWG